MKTKTEAPAAKHTPTYFKFGYAMNPEKLITPELLKDLGACSEGLEWAKPVIGPKGMKLSKLLPLMDRADWMLWLLNRTAMIEKIVYVRIAIKCAESVIEIY